jgi:dihydrofolate reductase
VRRIVQQASVSLDGYFEGPGGDIGWHLVDDEYFAEVNAVLGAMSAFLFGRVTYELMDEVWPTADSDPNSPPRTVEFARIYRDMPKVVFSRTLAGADGNSTVVRGVVPEEIRRMKELPGGDMVVGGANLADTFRRLDLIDEYRLYVHPVLLGEGTLLFRPVDAPVGLRLVETRTFGTGVVLLRYECPASAAG